MTVVPLQVYPTDTFDEHVLMLRAAKPTIDTDLLITPVPFQPGGPGTVLAFGELPDHVADVIFIAPDGINDVVRVSAALQHWLRGGAPTHTKADMFARFGMPVREITDPLEIDAIEVMLEQQGARLSNAGY